MHSVKISPPDKREKFSEHIANKYLQGMSGRDLENFFLEVQIERLMSCSHNELMSELEDVSDPFEDFLEILDN